MDEGHKIRVLLADDHAVVRAGTRRFLESAPDIQVVAEAENGELAVAEIKRHAPDVAVLDIRMPLMNGIEVTRWIRANSPGTAVLILSAYDDDPYVMAVLRAGANGYVLKDALAREIVEAVCAVHAGKSALDPEIAGKLMAHVSGKPAGGAIEPLTDREMEVLTLVARGHTNKAIGYQLGISDRTVQGHLATIFGKLHAASRTEAVMRAVFLGWISSDIGGLDDDS